MTQRCLSLILLFYVKEDYNSRRVDDKDDTVLILLFHLKEDYNSRRVDDKDDLILLFYLKEDYNSRRVDDKDDTAQPHPSILSKGRLQQQEG